MAKAELALHICAIFNDRGLTQSEAAKLLKVDQPKISALMRGKLDGFSAERLFRFLNALGRDVQIVIRPNPRGAISARVSVRAAGAR
ncbi:XRE family transcriptional regulator [Candidatus Sumerlaeota bacterium]|nr:XRE family transcriptional regulator [Candidatus Sumerlaeota bacterium]MBI3736716.1 XRE family transcriptional regulator [Candidatus Sumerlaeota bacterium]